MKHHIILSTIILLSFTLKATSKTVYFPPDIKTSIDDSAWIEVALDPIVFNGIYEHLDLKNATLKIENIYYFNEDDLKSVIENANYLCQDSTSITSKTFSVYKDFTIKTTAYKRTTLDDITTKNISLFSFVNPVIFQDVVEFTAYHIDTKFHIVNFIIISGIAKNKDDLELQLKKIIDNTTYTTPKDIDMALHYPVTQIHQHAYAQKYTDYLLKKLNNLNRQTLSITDENAVRTFAEDIKSYLPDDENSDNNSSSNDPNSTANFWWKKAQKNKTKFNDYMDSLYINLEKTLTTTYRATYNDNNGNIKSKLDDFTIPEIIKYIKENLPKTVDIMMQQLTSIKSDSVEDEETEATSIPSSRRVTEPEDYNNPLSINRNNFSLFKDFSLPTLGFSFTHYFDLQTTIVNGNYTINEYLNNLTESKINPLDNATIKTENKPKNNIEQYQELPIPYNTMIETSFFVNKIKKEIFNGKYDFQYISNMGTESKFVKDKNITSSVWYLCSTNKYNDDAVKDYIILSFTKTGNQWISNYSVLKANFGKYDYQMPGISFSDNSIGAEYAIIAYGKEKFIADKSNHAKGGWTTIEYNDSAYFKTYPLSLTNCVYSTVGCGEEEQNTISINEIIINSALQPELAKIEALKDKSQIAEKQLCVDIYKELQKYDFDNNKLPKESITKFTDRNKIVSELDNKCSELQRDYCANLLPSKRLYSSELYFDDLNLDGKNEIFYIAMSNGKIINYSIYTIKENKVVKYENPNALKQLQSIKSYKTLEEKSRQEIESDLSMYEYGE